MQDVFSTSMKKQGVKPLKLLVESRMEEKNKQNMSAQGLQERREVLDETPIPAVSKYSIFRDSILNIL